MDASLPYDVTQFGISRIAFTLLALSLPFAWVRCRQELARLMGKEPMLWLWGAAAVAVALRLGWPNLAVFHENGHGYRYIGMAIDPESDLHVYGSGYAAFYSLLYTLLPPLTTVILFTNVILGSLTVVFLGLFGARCFGARAGTMSAWALALLPVHIKLSATESPFILAIFLTVVGLWALSELRERRSYSLALVAGLAAGLAPQTRPLMIAVPAFLFLFALLSRPDALGWLKERSAWLFIGTAVSVLYLHVAWMLELHGEGGRLTGYGQFLELGAERTVNAMSSHGLLFKPAFTPVHFLALGAIGCAAAWKSHRRPALLLAAGFLAITWLYGARANHYSEALRFAAVPQVMLVLLVGPALSGAVDWLAPSSPPRRLHFLGPAILLLTALCSHAAITTETVDSIESEFIQESYATLPTECAIITPPSRMGRGRIESSFPFYEYRARLPGNDNFNWGLSRIDQPMLDGLRNNNPCVLYFRGLACSTFLPEESLEVSTRKECAVFEKSLSLRKVTSRVVDGSELPRHLHRHPQGTFELGFFLLEGTP